MLLIFTETCSLKNDAVLSGGQVYRCKSITQEGLMMNAYFFFWHMAFLQ
jgi:hypothetical protein